MKIKTRLILIALLPSFFLLAISISAWKFQLRIEQSNAKVAAIENIKKIIFEKTSLNQEYLLYGSTRVASQLNRLHSDMSEALSRLDFDEPEDYRLLQELRKSHNEQDQLLLLLTQQKDMGKNLIAGSLLTKAQQMRHQALQLAERQQLQTANMQRQANRLTIAALLALTTLSAILLWLMTLRLRQGINELVTGIDIVKSGTLLRRIPVSAKDELGQLALSFNSMIERLEITEAELKERTAKLTASNKELEAFSYSVSHDLRAPLRSIAGFVELLKKHNYDSIDDKGRHYMDVISASAVQMGKLIDDILTFSRIGRVEMKPTRVSLDPVLDEVMSTLRPQTAGRQIEWKINLLPEVDGERSMLSLVLLNLISNALKFTQPRDVAVIEIGQVERAQENSIHQPADSKDQENEVICYVKDNGVGFDMRYANKLFGLFQRLHSQEEFEGTGVGLANVQRIIERHGGRVWAEGKVNEGATFFFALPKPGS